MKPTHLLLPIFFICACSSHNSDILEFDPHALENNRITLAEVADDIKYIPLDNYYPMGRIIFLKMTSNSIFIYEPRYGILALIGMAKKGKESEILDEDLESIPTSTLSL